MRLAGDGCACAPVSSDCSAFDLVLLVVVGWLVGWRRRSDRQGKQRVRALFNIVAPIMLPRAHPRFGG